MTESTQPEAPAIEATKPSHSNVSEASKPVAPEPVVRKSGTGLSLFACLLAVLALAGTGYSWYVTQVDRVVQSTDIAVGVTEIGGNVSRLGDSIARLQTQQDKAVTQEQLTTQVLQATSAFDQQITAIGNQQNELRAAIDKVNEDLQKGVNDFVIDEVSQLLKLANNSVLFSADATSAIKALRLADIQLKELADPRFSDVRRKINEEILLLESIAPLDLENLSVRLRSLSAAVPTLPLENEPPAKSDVVLLDEVQAEQVSWRSELRQMWRDIVNSIQVQRVDKAPKPLLAPQQRYFLNQNLQLSLAKAELALLQNQASIYANSLADAETWLNEYFDVQSADVTAMLNEISALKQVTVNQTLPTVTDSYDLLQSIKGRL